jgi:fructose-bisphosphate aldolase class I
MSMGEGRPSSGCVHANAHALARYAALCQQLGMVPIVEPDLLMDGDHDLAHCRLVLGTILEAIFSELASQKVDLEHVILKPSMVTAGKECSEQASPFEVAEATVSCLRQNVPNAVPAVFFLSGGQGEEEATENLKAINSRGPQSWMLSFCFGRALQASALKAWSGKEKKVGAAQKTFIERARSNAEAVVNLPTES